MNYRFMSGHQSPRSSRPRRQARRHLVPRQPELRLSVPRHTVPTVASQAVLSAPALIDRYSPTMGGGSPKQKERFSRAWVIAAASAADFTYQIVADDERGVDMTIHSHDHTLDFQLKATSHPEVQDGCLIHDLDMRTYDLLRSQQRSGYGVLVLVVVGADTAAWHVMDDHGTSLTRSAYYLPLYGMPPRSNTARVRLKVPMSNLLTAGAMRTLMAAEAARWGS